MNLKLHVKVHGETHENFRILKCKIVESSRDYCHLSNNKIKKNKCKSLLKLGEDKRTVVGFLFCFVDLILLW